jgi:hypothetical protein
VTGRDLVLEEFSGDVSGMISFVSKFYWSAVQVVWFANVKINSLALTFLITRKYGDAYLYLPVTSVASAMGSSSLI